MTCATAGGPGAGVPQPLRIVPAGGGPVNPADSPATLGGSGSYRSDAPLRLGYMAGRLISGDGPRPSIPGPCEAPGHLHIAHISAALVVQLILLGFAQEAGAQL